ncbi:MAG TPA: hypothetical protein VEU62_10545, partial [Bryobacterales bacterium]|nr:hypothetical protein [Bryobacterales bacterium]
ERAADLVYNLPAVVAPEQMIPSLFFLARNWKIDVLVIHHSLAGYGVAADLRKALPGLTVVELVEAVEEQWTGECAQVSAECRPDLRVVVTEEGRQWWRGLDLEQLAPATGVAKTVLLAGPEFEDRSAAADAFFPAGQRRATPELHGVEVNLGDCLQLRGLRFCEKEGLLTLEMEWRCLHPPERPLRCFAHVVGRDGKALGSLDHEILRGAPPITDWKPGDAGYEARCLILPAKAARGATLRLGLFDPETGLRTPVWASTLPLVDDYTAAVVDPNSAPGAGCRFEMRPAPLEECDVHFEGGLRLTGRSFVRAGDVGWLRLRWSAPGRPKGNVHFFGHVVVEPSPAAPILLSFDHDTGLGRMHNPGSEELVAVQDIVRDVSKLGEGARFLRAGLFDGERPDVRLPVRSSSLPMSKQENAVYLPLQAATQEARESSAARR